MTDEELAAVREFTGDLLVRAFRGEVDLASALAEVRDLSSEQLVEEAELPDDLDDDDEDDLELEDDDFESEPPLDDEVSPLDDGTIADTEAEMEAALTAALLQ